jgi:mono/diheme cytochrome c family protein
MRWVHFFMVLALCVVACAPGSRAQESGEPKRGLAVAREHCAGCHAVAPGERTSPNPFAPPFEDMANLSGMTAIALNHLLHSSHESMPLLVLAPDEQWHIVAHILSLRRQERSPERR